MWCTKMDFNLYNKQIRIRERITPQKAELIRRRLTEDGAKNVLVYLRDGLIMLDTNLTEMQLTRILTEYAVTVLDVSETCRTPDV
ncbi:MAG: hypothetical protein IJY85_05010 [Ruminococcus sp.]|nr:hypothetical protein [Ruminococcus sp.]